MQTQELKAVELWPSRMQQLQMENCLLQAEIKQTRDELLLAETQVSVYTYTLLAEVHSLV